MPFGGGGGGGDKEEEEEDAETEDEIVLVSPTSAAAAAAAAVATAAGATATKKRRRRRGGSGDEDAGQPNKTRRPRRKARKEHNKQNNTVDREGKTLEDLVKENEELRVLIDKIAQEGSQPSARTVAATCRTALALKGLLHQQDGHETLSIEIGPCLPADFTAAYRTVVARSPAAGRARAPSNLTTTASEAQDEDSAGAGAAVCNADSACGGGGGGGAIDDPSLDELSVLSRNLVGQLRDLAAPYVEALRADLKASTMSRDQRMQALDSGVGAVCVELLNLALDLWKTYSPDSTGAHPASLLTKPAATSAPNFQLFCRTLGWNAAALPIGTTDKTPARSMAPQGKPTKQQQHMTRNSWAGRLVDMIDTRPRTASTAIMAGHLHELQRWEPREASLFRLSAEGHSRATLFETLCSPFREAMAHSGSSSSSSSSSNNNNSNLRSSSPFSMICAVHAELYEHRPSADEVLTASHAYSNLCQALGIGPRLAPEGLYEGSAVSGLRKMLDDGLERLLLFHGLTNVDAASIPSFTAMELLFFAALGGLLLGLTPGDRARLARVSSEPSVPLSASFESGAWDISPVFDSVLLFDAPPHPEPGAYLTQVFTSVKVDTLLAGGVRTRALPVGPLSAFLLQHSTTTTTTTTTKTIMES